MSSVPRLPKDWETDLENRLMKVQKESQSHKIYICSPCRASNVDEWKANIKAARFYAYYSLKYIGVFARAPHMYLPIITNDDVPEERSLALRFGNEFLELHHELYVCGETISSGMHGEIVTATLSDKQIQVFDEDVYKQTCNIVIQNGGLKSLVNYTRFDPILGYSPKRLLYWGVI